MTQNPLTGQTDVTDPVARVLLAQAMQQRPMYHWAEPLGRLAQFGVGAFVEEGRRKGDEKEWNDAVSGLFDLNRTTSAPPTTPGPTGPRPQPMMDAAAPALALEAAQKVGVDPAYLTRLTGAESGFNPAATSDQGAAGLGQFLPGTWKTYIAKYGPLYGYGPETPPSDARANMLMTAHYTKDSMEDFRRRQGRDPAPAELYAMHFLGPEGSQRLFGNPGATMDQLFPELVSKTLPNGQPNPRYSPANIAAMTSGGRFLTGAEMLQRLGGKVGGPAPSPGGAQVARAPGAAEAPQAAPAPGAPSAISEATKAKIISLMKSKNPRVQALGMQLFQTYAKPEHFEFKSAGDQAYRWNPRTGMAEPILDVPKPAPTGYRYKEGSRTELEAVPGGPAHDPAKLRKEIQDLPSYKNLSQAAPVYKSMLDAAGRDNRAADVNLIYGMAKIMDPGSVVRESEMTIAQAVATLPQYLRSNVESQLRATGRLSPEVREAIMGEAYSRVSAYRGMFDQDVTQYRGIAERYRYDVRDVIPEFSPLPVYQRPSTTTGAPDVPRGAPGSSPKDAGQLPGGIKWKRLQK